MKKIQSQLIKPFVEKMEAEWQSFYDQLYQSKDPEAEELRPIAKTHLDKLRQLLSQPDANLDGPESVTENMREFMRQSKMDFRTAERKWTRHLVSTERVKTRLANYSAKFPDAEKRKKS